MKQPCRHQGVSSEDGGGEDAAGAGVEICLQAMKIMVVQIAPLQPMEDHDRADIHRAAMEDPI